MNVYEEDKFVLKDENGIKRVFYKMITFTSSITNKSYLIYTDNSFTNGKVNIYSSIIKSNNDDLELEIVVDEVDKKEIEKALLKTKLNSN